MKWIGDDRTTALVSICRILLVDANSLVGPNNSVIRCSVILPRNNIAYYEVK